MSLIKTIEMMNEFCSVLIDMERRGIHIDTIALEQLRKDTEQERSQLQDKLYNLAYEALGDTPVNLNSPEQLSQLIFSRKLTDKNSWSKHFMLTTGEKTVYRKHRLARLSKNDFLSGIKKYTAPMYKTKAVKCIACNGTGNIKKYTKTGSLYKKLPKCKRCEGNGIFYNSTTEIAGFNLPLNKTNITANGFGTDKKTLNYMLQHSKTDEATQFLSCLIRHNALNTYLDSFVSGIQKGLVGNILHPQFNQCVTSTGRLSSKNPNFQNQPRGDTFPIRRVVTSRFEGGKILEVDFAQLEFRVAAYMSGDERAIEDIKNGVDIHMMSASALGITRQEAKAETFAPLYGASRDWGLLDRYPKIKEWHKKLMEEAIKTKQIVMPTGRILGFPHTKRTQHGGATGATNIKNYPVQSFATADIVPIVCIEVDKALEKYDSLLVNTVHDSVVIDVCKKELDIVPKLVYDVCSNTKEYLKQRYDIDFTVPLEVEAKIGDNWLDTKEIAL